MFTTLAPPSPSTFTVSNVSVTGSQRAAVDMNGDFLDDVVSIGNTNVNIFYQQATGGLSSTATNITTTSADNSPSWSLAAADFDRNGFTDLLYGGGNGVTFMKANNTGDGNDFIFPTTASGISMIWAVGPSTNTSSKHATRGATAVGTTLGISENKLLSFKMFPNPASDLVNIQLPTGSDKAEVSIFDYTGRLMKSKTITSNDSKLDVNNLSNGMYLIRVTSNNKIGAQRFIKN